MPDLLDVLKIAIPVAGSIVVAWITSRTTAQRTQGDLSARVKTLEENEPADQAKLRTDLEALAADVATIRGAVERLQVAHEKLVADDEKRRDKAAERAERRETREREQETALAAKLATVHTLLETLKEEIRDARR